MNIENLNRARNAALAFILAAGLSLPTAGLAYAADDDSDSDDISTKVKDKLNNLFNEDSDEENVAKKTESVYVFTKADGTVKNTIVADWLKNADKDASIHDISSLSNIENTEGKESYEAKGESLVWDAQGSDIYYQGDSDKAAPIQMKVTYWVDGQKVPADQMLGKSGHVKMRYSFKNKSYSTEYVDGAARTIYTPFFCVTGMILDNDVFSNVTTKNAKATNDGDRTLVGGYAMPGLQEDLDIDVDDYEFPTYFEVEADVEDFELGTTATLVTSSLFDDLNTDELDDSDIQDALNELADGMDQLLDGTSELYDGLQELDDGGQELADGTAELAEKTESLPDSAQQLADGSAALAKGLVSAVSGTSELAVGNKQITDGLDQLVNGTDTATGLVDAVSGVEQLRAGVDGADTDGDGDVDTVGLTAGLQQVSGGLNQVLNGTDENPGGLNAAVTALGSVDVSAMSESLGTAKSASDTAATMAENSVTKATAAVNALNGMNTDGMTDEQKQAVNKALTALTSTDQSNPGAVYSATVAQQYAQNVGGGLASSAKTVSGLGTQVTALQSGLSTATDALSTMQTALENQLIPGSQQISAGLDQLNNGGTTADGRESKGLNGAVDGANALLKGNKSVDSGLESLGSGLDDASDGADELAGGLSQLNDAVPALTAGIQALKEGSEQLSDGIGQAKDGTAELKDGLEEFNEEGVQKIIDAYNDNLAGLTDRLKATAEAGKAYDNFSGKSDSMKGSVKFIFETDAIEADDDDDDSDSSDADISDVIDGSDSAATEESSSSN